MIWSATVQKEGLLSLGQGNGMFPRVERSEELEGLRHRAGGENFVLVWTEEPTKREAPRVIIVGPESRADFFAFVSTYLPHLTPLSAYIRVLSSDWLESTIQIAPLYRDALSEAGVGLVLCEAAGYLESTIEAPRYRTAAATQSFPVARWAMARNSLFRLDEVSNAWQLARRLCGEQKIRFSSADLLAPWAVLRSLAELGPGVSAQVPLEVLNACQSLLEDRGHSLPFLPSEYRSASVNGTREDKVQVFERFTHDALSGLLPISNPTLVAFGLGFLCSEISRGGLEHLPLLNPVLSRYPAALLWYGLCAGLHRQGSTFSYGKGLGRLVYRELSRELNLLDIPTCDISLDELEVITRRTGRFPEIATSSSSYVDIELLPSVTCSFSVPSRKDVARPAQPESTRLDKMALSRRLDIVIDALEHVQEELSGDSGQRLPFDKRRSRGSRKRT